MEINYNDKVMAALIGLLNYIQPSSDMSWQQLDRLIIEAADAVRGDD